LPANDSNRKACQSAIQSRDLLMSGKITATQTMSGITCPLCKAGKVNTMCRDRLRAYLRCGSCSLVFVLPHYYLSADKEKARYDLHRNSPDDRDYRQFLSRLYIPLQKRLLPGSHGLDFGSGPGPTLSIMFEEAGHTMSLYDYYYARQPAALNREYDFITATEVVKPGGYMGIMTKLYPQCETFAEWPYKNDLTHVCYFSHLTFEWLAVHWQAEATLIDDGVIIFRKLSESDTTVSTF
jgi:hypothetical protein